MTSIYTFEPVWTDAGIALAHSLPEGVEMKVDAVAVGDGGGSGYIPSESMTALVNEVERSSVIGGFPLPLGRSMQINAIIEGSALEYNVREIAFYRGATMVLVYSRVTNPIIFNKTLGVGLSMPLTISLRRFRELAPEVAITVENSPDLPAMVLQMQVHEAKANPHPQYAGQAALVALAEDMDDQTAAIADALALETDLRENAVDDLQLQINDLTNDIADLYPKVVGSGVISYQGGSSSSLLGATNGWSFNPASRHIYRGGGGDLYNSRYAILITPESQHEGWSLVRTTEGFTLDVFNRSGQNRIGYNGNVSWQVVENNAPTASDGNGTYGVGTYLIPIQAGQSKTFTLYGSGAGGGGSRNDGIGTCDGFDGEDTTISGAFGSVVAGGGKKGIGGVWANGSAYTDGTAGAGGIATGGNVSNINGNAGTATMSNQDGGAAIASGDGFGGNGSIGLGDDGYSWGGGAGSGAKTVHTVTNSTGSVMTVSLTVGRGGDASALGTGMTNGGNGKAVVTN